MTDTERNQPPGLVQKPGLDPRDIGVRPPMMGPRAAGRSANQKTLLAEQIIEAVEQGHLVTLSPGSGTIDISLSGPNQFTSMPDHDDDEAFEMACAWSDYRKDYGVSSDDKVRSKEYAAFTEGWKAGRYGDQSSVLR